MRQKFLQTAKFSLLTVTFNGAYISLSFDIIAIPMAQQIEFMKKMSLQNQPRRKAFTLIELLVVIAIIAILAAMLLPALAAAKSRANAAIDINNCKETMLATAIYCNDNTDHMPAPGWLLGADCWITAANPPDMNAHSKATFQNDYDQQVSWFTGRQASEPGSPTPPHSGQLYQFLKNPKIFLCPQDVVNAAFLQRDEIISSYVWNGAVVGYQNGNVPYKITSFKPTNILQWENDEKNTAGGEWNDFSNYPLETGAPTFSQRHGKASQVGKIDGSAGRVSYISMVSWANATTVPNDLWCSPATTTGH